VIVDSSAVIAILRRESGAQALLEKIGTTPNRKMSVANFLETAIVVDSKRSPIASRDLDEFIREARIVLCPVDEVQARIAREAYRDFGRGSGHAARLNFGDCFAYALAKAMGEPLLYKGTDFSRTDVVSAL
jgi:ribonuclease VapC